MHVDAKGGFSHGVWSCSEFRLDVEYCTAVADATAGHDSLSNACSKGRQDDYLHLSVMPSMTGDHVTALPHAIVGPPVQTVSRYTAAGYSGRMPMAELADAIVESGRQTLIAAAKTVGACTTQKQCTLLSEGTNRSFLE